MFRFLVLCVFLGGASIVGVLALAPIVNPSPDDAAQGARPGLPFIGQAAKDPAVEKPEGSRGEGNREQSKPDLTVDDKPVAVYEVAADVGLNRPLIFPGARVLPMERQEVPSEREGKLLILGTPVDKTEYDRLPEHRRAWMIVPMLAVYPKANETVEPSERIIDPESPMTYYRRPRVTDSFEPRTTTIIREKIYFRKLSENDPVKKNDILGVINPAVALEELAVKQSKVGAAASDVDASKSMLEEAKRRYSSIQKSIAAVRGSVTEDDKGAALVTVDRYQAETHAKAAAVVQSQRELSAAWTTLEMYLIRAAIPGQVRTLYKQTGDAVKMLEPVLQLNNSQQMRVEAQVEVQEALRLRELLDRAKGMRIKANALARTARMETAETAKLRQDAASLLSVEVEASRPEPPLAVLSGHLQDVTAVAITRGATPKIISGSEEGVVRIWNRGAQDRWQEAMRLDHGAAVRALACTGPQGKENLLATGSATGRCRFFDVDNIKSGERLTKDRHNGAINSVAFNSNGTLCATGGDDLAIILWDPATGEKLGKMTGAHTSAVTSVVFTPDGRLLSTGRDKRLLVWSLGDNGDGKYTLKRETTISGRSGDLSQIGIDPTGENVLFDDHRELRVLSLKTQRIEGTLNNPDATGSFSTFALFSPDAKTILTNGNGAGRLQLWRAPSNKNRAAELRQLLWSTGTMTCAAFDPNGKFIVTGTSDHRVLVWAMPSNDEAEKALPAELTYVEDFLDTNLKRVTVRATLSNPGWVIAGANATIVVPPRQ